MGRGHIVIFLLGLFCPFCTYKEAALSQLKCRCTAAPSVLGDRGLACCHGNQLTGLKSRYLILLLTRRKSRVQVTCSGHVMKGENELNGQREQKLLTRCAAGASGENLHHGHPNTPLPTTRKASELKITFWSKCRVVFFVPGGSDTIQQSQEWSKGLDSSRVPLLLNWCH